MLVCTSMWMQTLLTVVRALFSLATSPLLPLLDLVSGDSCGDCDLTSGSSSPKGDALPLLNRDCDVEGNSWRKRPRMPFFTLLACRGDNRMQHYMALIAHSLRNDAVRRWSQRQRPYTPKTCSEISSLQTASFFTAHVLRIS
jgi:hypothetical protein